MYEISQNARTAKAKMIQAPSVYAADDKERRAQHHGIPVKNTTCNAAFLCSASDGTDRRRGRISYLTGNIRGPGA